VKLSHVIDELVEERGLDRAVISGIVCEGLKAAYEKKYPGLPISVSYDKKNDELSIAIEKKVVSQVSDEDIEVSIRKAKAIKPDIAVGDVIILPFELPIGRIEILKAKQVIAQKIRSIEASAIYQEFKPREGAVVQGVIHKCERSGATIKLHDAFAFLPKSLMLPEDKCIVGYPIRALLKEVLLEPRHENQLILDRASALFVQRLFELEIPEVYERLVEVKRVVRTPGYKSKVLVSSNDKNIDPVGTCVGVGGARIKPILRELGVEKVDVIADTRSLEELVKSSLKPAEVNRVELIDQTSANVWVDDDQRSVAIGKGGQNIALASQLSGVAIHLVKPEGGSLDQDEAEFGSDQ
jgi:transcription termination/antitermination protein NusA